VNIRDIKIVGLLSLLVLFPSINFFQRYLFEIVVLTTLFMQLKFNRIFSINNIIFLSLMFLISFFHSIIDPSFGEIEDYVRLIIFIMFVGYLSDKITFRRIDLTLLVLLVINLVAVTYFNNGDTYGISKYIHSKDLLNSYGRHSGAFSNVAILGLFSLVIIIYNIGVALYEKSSNGYYRWLLVFLGLYLVLESGSKTSMISSITIIILMLLHKLIILKNIRMVLVVIFVSTGVMYLAYDSLIAYRELGVVLSILGGKYSSASSLFTRFEIWSHVISQNISSNISLIIGSPKIVLDSITTTYDNDYLWFFGRFGLIGLFMIVSIQVSLLYKLFRVRNILPSKLTLFWTFLSFLIAGFGLGVITTPQVITLLLIIVSPAISLKNYNRKFYLGTQGIVKYHYEATPSKS